MILLTWGLAGCGSGSQNTGFTNPNLPAPGPLASAPARQTLTVTGAVPPGATQLRVSGEDIEGEQRFTTTMPAADRVEARLPNSVHTILLEYLNERGEVVARYAQSAIDDVEFHDGVISDPPLVIVLPPGRAAKGELSATEGTVTVAGPDVKFSFAFFGCNRAKAAGTDPIYPGQVSDTERASTANMAQLRQHFMDVGTLQPNPKYIFLCGDVVTKAKRNGPTGSAAGVASTVRDELLNWKTIRAHGATIINSNGESTAVTPPAAGSLFGGNSFKVVVMPGNHEMCWSYSDGTDPHPSGENWSYEFPLKELGEAFVSPMKPFILGTNGPKPGEVYDVGALTLPDDPVQRDESQLSYTFRDGENVFVVLNTDTYVGDTVFSGGAYQHKIRRIPLRWLRVKLREHQADSTVRHIFVFGHRPIQAVNSEAGVDDGQKDLFYKLLNNPLAETMAELDVPAPGTPPTKVRGYFCAHAHLFSLKQPSGRKPVQQVVCGSGGSDPDPAPTDEGALVGVTPGQKYPWFGFAVVAVRTLTANVDEVDMAFFGRNAHFKEKYPAPSQWWEQEPLKQRGPNITGPGTKPAKTPKEIRSLYRDPF